MKNKGFTLIEILIVVSIIGVITAIILVNLNSGKEKAIGIKSVTELDQLKKALELYRTDNGKYPGEGEGKTYDFYPNDGSDGYVDGFLKKELVDKSYISTIPYYVAANADFTYTTKDEDLKRYSCSGQNFTKYMVYLMSNSQKLTMSKVISGGEIICGDDGCYYCFGQ